MLVHNIEKHLYVAEMPPRPIMEKGPDGKERQQIAKNPKTGDETPLFAPVEGVKFPPGITRMSADDITRAKENTGFMIRFKGVNAKGEPMKTGATIKVVASDDHLPKEELQALAIIDATTDVPLLKDWLLQSRGTVRDAIEMRILLFDDIQEYERRMARRGN